MGAPFNYLPQQFKIVTATATTTTNATVTMDNVSLKNVKRAWILLQYLQAASHATTFTPKLGTAVSAAATAITFSANWWKCADVSTSDALTAQTAATTMACTAGTTNQIVLIEIDPAQVAAQGAYDVLGGTIATSSQSGNFVTGVYLLEMKYEQATPPTAITD
jgi:hypothetical protein